MKKSLLFLALMTVCLNAGAQTVTTYALPDSLSPGDTFKYIITASYASSMTPVYPSEADFGDPFELLNTSRLRGKITSDSIVYTVQYFGLKDTLIPPKNILFITSQDTLILPTVAVPIYFKSSILGAGQELMPFKPIFGFAPPWLLYVFIALLILLIGYLIWRYRSKFKPAEKPPVPAPVEIPYFTSPYVILQKRIEELRQIESFKNEAYRPLYFELSIAIRRYFEDVYHILALESTTREMIFDLNRAGADDTLIAETSAILKTCDMVKFAKLEVDQNDALNIIAKSSALLNTIRKNDQFRLKALRQEHDARYGVSDKTRSELLLDQETNSPESNLSRL